MKDTVYLILTRTGVTKMTKREPTRDPGEYVVGVNVVVPDEVFKRSPVPQVELNLSGTNLGVPNVAVGGLVAESSVDDAARQHGVALQSLAAMFEAARASSDPNMQAIAKHTLDELLEAGVDVKIVASDAERVGDPE